MMSLLSGENRITLNHETIIKMLINELPNVLPAEFLQLIEVTSLTLTTAGNEYQAMIRFQPKTDPPPPPPPPGRKLEVGK